MLYEQYGIPQMCEGIHLASYLKQMQTDRLIFLRFVFNRKKIAIYIYEGLDSGLIVSNIYWILFPSGLHNALNFFMLE